MSESNGNKAWIMWVLGIIIITVLPFIGNAVITNDKESRSRDDQIKENLQKCTVEQQQVNQQILVSLKEIQTDLRYIRKAQ